MQTSVTLVGNVVNDVVLRQTSGGTVANFRLAATNGYTDKRTGQFVERTTFLNVSAWRQFAENVAASVFRGQPVVVVGRLRQREFERDGQKITVVEVDADFVGHDLSRGVAQFARNRRGPQTAELAAAAVVVPDHLPDGWATPPAGDGVPQEPAA
jgi:single-strand DNA-binding protein